MMYLKSINAFGRRGRWIIGRQFSDIVLTNTMNNVTTITMNMPEKLNGWTEPMLKAVQASVLQARKEPECKVIILTGAGDYYCAGVNLAGVLKIMAPSKVLREIEAHNKRLFDLFLDTEKPIIVAVNGPAIGASVTSATLCNAIIASDTATFLTPFGRLGVTPEGCSSVHFPRLIGEEAAHKMLHEDWQPTAKEAKDIGLITDVVPQADLQTAAQKLAESWIAENNMKRTAMGYEDFDHLREVNARESKDLARAFVSEKFLQGQIDFLTKKKKDPTMFKILLASRKLWSRFL